MTKKITNANIYRMADAIKKNNEKGNKGLPSSLTYDGITYTWVDMMYVMAYAVNHLNSDCTIPNLNKPSSPWTGDTIEEQIKKDDFLKQVSNILNFVSKNNNTVPNYVTTVKSKKRVNANLYTFCFAKILVYYKEHNKTLPLQCLYRSSDVISQKPRTYSEQIYDYFCSKFGKVTTIDDALKKVQSKGYGYYYDDKLTNKQTIDGLATRGGTKPNCTDIHHMAWHLGKAMGYDVRAVHVKCRGGDGHVRLDFKKGSTGWFSRDFSAVADGECITCIWCGNGTILAYNPQWFLNNLNR